MNSGNGNLIAVHHEVKCPIDCGVDTTYCFGVTKKSAQGLLVMRDGLSLIVFAGLCVLSGCAGSEPSGSNSTNPGPVATNTVLTATPNPVTAGANVSLSAAVSSSGGGTPSGNVNFFDGTTNLGTAALSNGTASLALSMLAAGTHSITASYAGSGGYQASTSTSVALVVNAAAPPVVTTTVLSATPNPAAAAATVTLNAIVTSSNTSLTPTGSVSFYDGANLQGSSTLTSGSGPVNTGAAVYTISTLAAGTTHNLTATYVGNTSFAASTSTVIALVVNPSYTANANFSFTTAHQTIAGFGGAEAFYANYLDSHPYEPQIMTALFDPVNGLGITMLRLQNNYYNYNGSNASSFDPDNTKIVTAATSALGSPLTILMSSWTPPASLKSNNSINGCTGVTNGNCTGGFGTLAQVNGAYNYYGFGQFWLSSLQAYAAIGVIPKYISIQNEPDFPATYVGCLFNPTEAPANLYQGTQSYASYGLAFDATYKAINGGVLASVPQMIGPESFSISNAQALTTQVPANELAVVAHHLYNVSSYGGDPASQVSPMTAFNSAFPTLLKFATEYFQAPGFYNAIDIHNALTIANDSAYIYWGLTWPSTLTNGVATDQQGLLYIDNPFTPSSWAYTNGWTYNDAYYALKHFSYFIRPGYVRYNATISNADEDISVYQSPDTKTTVIVILNTSTAITDNVGLDLSSIHYINSAVYRSSFATPITSPGAERWNKLGTYTSQGISLPPQSEVTVVLTN
jgi:glucuronoarabinoxylan endo-1,4-beta-xylanase